MGICPVCGEIGNHSICNQLLSLQNENKKNIEEINSLKGKNTEIENSMNSYQSQLNSFQEKENERIMTEFNKYTNLNIQNEQNEEEELIINSNKNSEKTNNDNEAISNDEYFNNLMDPSNAFFPEIFP